MLYTILALLLIFALFTLGLTQSSSHGSLNFYTSLHNRFFKEQGAQGYPNHTTFPVMFLLILYGALGIKIYTTTFHIQLSYQAIAFWISYSLASFIAYVFLPAYIAKKLSKEATVPLRLLPSILQLFFLPLQKLYQNQTTSCPLLKPSFTFQTPLSETLIAFDKLIVREVMIPKVDIFALPEETTLKEALDLIIEEGYSRVPIYKKNLDNITGILLVKDLLQLYKNTHDPNQPVSLVAKPPFYAPEIKKAASLLQEFRQKHRHLAIIVNEYGFTEGIATMEDIIEEIIGEIADEHDVQEDIPYKKIGNSWIVDGRMNISDAEDYFKLKIDHQNSYDTLGGHVFHKVGAVPQKGMKIHHENFDIEIITCTERSVGKLKITPRKRKFPIP
ncbi:CBS domain-containing protein [Candidatus Chlamydia sanziniae]|uniref:Magnesium and cobalt efflux protein CorC n=1 Tax=Candidatus Chlamydia sanziniae TaxID=1806891 RepID=A0A1A9HW82_9CHLA|nr:hemolysin family protein [Candidatus Chlamydia sanziniae]ANH78304.1 Magnesium and cobalt efflux protein CorC [Candidatus Chlamydia sanziniae]